LVASLFSLAVIVCAVWFLLVMKSIRNLTFPPSFSAFHQITLILSILGTQDISSKHQESYLANLPKKYKVPFAKIFPYASAQACDLLDKLLQFEPENRYTVEQALRHPYLEELHCEEDEVCLALHFFSRNSARSNTTSLFVFVAEL
jgi:serine/threonine protein kinase